LKAELDGSGGGGEAGGEGAINCGLEVGHGVRDADGVEVNIAEVDLCEVLEIGEIGAELEGAAEIAGEAGVIGGFDIEAEAELIN
jgi:hypothetical protein